jgi:hypothetical protein
MPVNLATWEAETGKIVSLRQVGHTVCETAPHLPTPAPPTPPTPPSPKQLGKIAWRCNSSSVMSLLCKHEALSSNHSPNYLI